MRYRYLSKRTIMKFFDTLMRLKIDDEKMTVQEYAAWLTLLDIHVEDQIWGRKNDDC